MANLYVRKNYNLINNCPLEFIQRYISKSPDSNSSGGLFRRLSVEDIIMI